MSRSGPTGRVALAAGRSPIGSSAFAALASLVAVTAVVAACITPSIEVPPTGVVPGSAGPSASALSSSSPSLAPGLSPSPTPATTALVPACPGTDHTPGAPPGRLVLGSSANWSGYVSAVKKTGVTCVEGGWVEPTVTCPRTGHQAVAIWIGIDGFSSRLLGISASTALVQIGTQADCRNGVASHGAWHEVLPAEQQEIPAVGEVRAGDHIAARILYTGGHFVMTIADLESQATFSISVSAPGAVRRTAEWIVEAPATGCPTACTIIPLPRFSTVRFRNAHVTISGQRAAIDDDRWTAIRLWMTRRSVLRTKASVLSLGGTSFGVTWIHA